jgi:cytochrome c peroxidase
MLPIDRAVAHGPTPPPLTGVKVPATPGLLDGKTPIVVNKALATVLGKAFFWDTNVGSDGVTCAVCHHKAGSDSRITNQMAPGKLNSAPSGDTYEPTASGQSGGPNYTLQKADFPFHQFTDPLNRNSDVTFTTDDVVGSAGSFSGQFKSVKTSGSGWDDCVRAPIEPYTDFGLGMRQVTNRSIHPIVNAALQQRNERNLSANLVFNGVNPLGDRDPKAFVWVTKTPNSVAKARMSLKNAGMASAAVGPPLSTREISCKGRTFSDIGRKLAGRRPLEFQDVHPQDSVLGPYRHASGKGLKLSYAQLIHKAFASRYWSANLSQSQRQSLFGKPSYGAPYTMTEANFPLFFGLAVKLYLDTLISDQTPFDSPRTQVKDQYGYYYPKAFNAQQRRGLKIFLDAHCFTCHNGPALSDAAYPEVMNHYNPKLPSDRFYADGLPTRFSVVDRRTLAKGLGLVDRAAANTGVTPSSFDPGLNTTDDFGNPISFTDQYIELLKGNKSKVKDPFIAYPCNFNNFNTMFIFDFKKSELTPTSKAGCNPLRTDYAFQPKAAVAKAEFQKKDHGRLRSGVNGAFIIPTLRNVELTGPYMHNGGMLTLEQVVEFYRRGGNFVNPETPVDGIFPQGDFITSKRDADDLVAFLKALTDERVRWEKAPFDHPSILLPHGGDISQPDADGLAKDIYVKLPAVGRNGRTKAQGPWKPFDQVLPN